MSSKTETFLKINDLCIFFQQNENQIIKDFQHIISTEENHSISDSHTTATQFITGEWCLHKHIQSQKQLFEHKHLHLCRIFLKILAVKKIRQFEIRTIKTYLSLEINKTLC